MTRVLSVLTLVAVATACTYDGAPSTWYGASYRYGTPIYVVDGWYRDYYWPSLFRRYPGCCYHDDDDDRDLWAARQRWIGPDDRSSRTVLRWVRPDHRSDLDRRRSAHDAAVLRARLERQREAERAAAAAERRAEKRRATKRAQRERERAAKRWVRPSPAQRWVGPNRSLRN